MKKKPTKSKPVKSRKLTDQQRRFCFEYVIDYNGKQAAIRAGYSETSAAELAYQLIHKTSCKAFIDELIKAQNEQLQISRADILRELLIIGKTDISKAYDSKGNLLPIDAIPEEIRRAIAGIKVFEEFEGYGKDRVKVGETRELKLWDKPRALELLGRHLKLWTDKTVTNNFTIEQLVMGSMEEEKKK